MLIYKITNQINKKIYIGKQVRKSNKYMGSGKLLKLAFEKYGIGNFTKEIIEYCENKKILSEREKFWIKKYNSTNRNIGYNITEGGEGNNTNRHFLGKKLTDEHKRKISENHHDVNGVNNPMFGKKHSENTKKCISEKRKGVKHNITTIKKYLNTRKGSNNSNSQLTEDIVLKIRDDYKTYKISEICLIYNLKQSCVWKIINRYTWKHI
jgi:group I intron endonuclease